MKVKREGELVQKFMLLKNKHRSFYFVIRKQHSQKKITLL